MRKKQDPQKEADAFNARFSLGEQVEYAEVVGGPSKRYKTRSEASVLSGHTAVVWLEGKSGCVCCSHITAVPSA